MICFLKCLHMWTIQCTVYDSRTIFKKKNFPEKEPECRSWVGDCSRNNPEYLTVTGDPYKNQTDTNDPEWFISVCDPEVLNFY